MNGAFSVKFIGFPVSCLMNPIFYEHTMMYSNILGDGKFYQPEDDGYVPWSLNIKSFFVVVDSLVEYNTIDLKFGDNNDDVEWKEYINIYVDGVCVGTSYFHTNTYISQRWIQDYYIEYLVNVFN